MSPLLLHGNTNQYNINGLLCTYTEMFCIHTCYNYILSAAEGRQHARIQGFLSVLFSPQLIFTVYRGGPMVLLLRKQYLYFTKYPEGVHYFPGGGGGGCQTFSRVGVQMLISLETHVRTPYPPLDPHMGNVIITGQYLSQSRF